MSKIKKIAGALTPTIDVIAGSHQGDWLQNGRNNPSERLTQGWVIFYG